MEMVGHDDVAPRLREPIPVAPSQTLHDRPSREKVIEDTDPVPRASSKQIRALGF